MENCSLGNPEEKTPKPLTPRERGEGGARAPSPVKKAHLPKPLGFPQSLSRGDCSTAGMGRAASVLATAPRSLRHVMINVTRRGVRGRKMVLEGHASFLPCVSRAMTLLLVLSAGRSPAVPEVCKYCPGPVHDTSQVDYYCKQRQELKLYARCCLTEQSTIVGLDLQNCSLKVLDQILVEAHSAIVLDLQANPLLNISTSDFRNFTELQILVLPPHMDCPGGDSAWDNVTCRPDSCTCLGQRNQCNSTMEQALCPENAYCVPDGPGLFQCLCTSDFHGYKCLREGSFPLLLFSGILGTTTFCISILLWGTQLRKIKAS